MKINIWAVGRQYDFTHRQARAVYEQLRELFEQEREEPMTLEIRTNSDARLIPSLFPERNGHVK